MDKPIQGKAVVVNDDPDQLRLVSTILAKDGLTIFPCHNADDALSTMKKEGCPDIVVTDLHMPGIDGWRFCRLLRSPEYADFNAVPILVVSATFFGEHTEKVSTDLGADAFLPAPFDGTALRTHVRALLEGELLRPASGVLIIDENPAEAESLKKAFETHAYSVNIATSIEQARRLYQDYAPDVVVLDYAMVNDQADELLPNFRNPESATAHVFIATNPTPEMASHFMHIGAEAYVRRPVDPFYTVTICEMARRERALLSIEDRLKIRTRELKESEERFRQLFESIPEAVLVHDMDGRILHINQAGAQRLEYLPEELVGETLSRFVIPVCADRIHQHVQNTVNNGFTQFETTFVAQSGRHIEAEVNERVIDFGGRRVILSVSRDVTIRNRNERRIAKLNECFLNFGPDPDENINLLTNLLGELFGATTAFYSRLHNGMLCRVGQWRSPPELSLLTKPEGHICYDAIRQKTNDVLVVRNLQSSAYATSDSNVRIGQWKTYIGYPVKCAGQHVGAACIFFNEDIEPTGDDRELLSIVASAIGVEEDRKQAALEKEKLESQIQHTQKLESLGVLAGGLAHDFNNLLVGILGNAELALQDLSELSPARQRLDDIKTAGMRASELTRQMLAYSGKGQFIIQPIDVNELVREMGHLLRASISKTIVFNHHFSENLPAIEGDAVQIRQVVMNLITNASEAIGNRSGVITLRTGLIEISRNDLAESFLNNNLPGGFYVAIEVLDTGVGMDEKTKSRMFDPFFTTKFAGRGLGLAAVMGIVRAHKGTIKVDSEIGKGSKFTVLFPSTGKAAPPADQPKADAHKDWKPKGTILVVDDDESVRNVAKMILERVGLNVITASDGREGIELFEKNKTGLAAVLLDMTMPHMSGEETFHEMHRLRPEVPVFLASGYNEQDIASRFTESEFAGIIQKPFQLQTLVAKIRSAIDRK